MKPKPIVVAPILLAALLAGGYLIDKSRERQRSALSGFFECQPTKVASRVAGRVSQIVAREGDAVKKGDVLIVLEASPSESDALAKKALASQAESALAEAANGSRQEDIARQKAAVQEAEATLKKLRNGPLPEEIRAARLKLAQAQLRYAKAKQGARPEEIAQAKAAERQMKAKLAQAERGLTSEEKAQAKARLDAAVSAERLAQASFDRQNNLLKDGAISKQAWDQAQSNLEAAQAKKREVQEAYNRAKEGTPNEELDQAREAYKQAQANLNLVLAGTRNEDLEAARADVAIAHESLRLLTNGTRAEDIEAAAARLDQARSALDLLRNGTRKERLDQAKDAAEAAKQQSKSADLTVKEKTILAPCDGIVERIVVSEGDLVSAGIAVAQISNPADMWLKVYVPEARIAQVTVGDEADLYIDGLNEPVKGRVDQVASRGEFTPANLQTPDERGKQVFAVKIRLKQPDPRIKQGMYASVRRVGQYQ